MKLRDIVSRIAIDDRKFTEYVLNPNSPTGKHKALVFDQVLGFNKDNYIYLIKQIEDED